MKVFILATIAVILFLLFLESSPIEFFGGSDWMASFYGQSIWNGWNYGTADPKRGPTPEYL